MQQLPEYNKSNLLGKYVRSIINPISLGNDVNQFMYADSIVQQLLE